MLNEGPKDRRTLFEAAVLPHLDTLYRAALRLTGGAGEAEDLVQETCLRAYRVIAQLREAERAKAWLFTILRRTYQQQWQHERCREPSCGLCPMNWAFEVGEEGGYQLGNNGHESVLMREDFRNAIATLPFCYREAFVLANIAGFSYREIAQILEVPVGTVMSRLYRARRELRLRLQDYREARVSGRRP